MCERVTLPGGGFAIVCGGHRGRRKKCFYCGEPGAFACDGPAPAGRPGTCDRAICRACRIHVPPNQDFCKHHRVQAADAAAQLRLFDHAPEPPCPKN